MRVNQLRKLRKDFHNLIGTLTTGSDDYDIRFRLFGDGMLKHRLSCTERTGDKSRTTFYNRIHSIDYTHTCFQQFKGTRFFFIIRHGAFHRPFLYHVHMNVISFFVSQYSYNIFDAVFTFIYDGLHSTHTFLGERYHDFQRLEVFVHLS